MGPKPVRIGLKRKASVALIDDDFSDEGDELMSQAVSVADHDETLAPLTNSTMKVLEKFVDLDLEKSISSVEDIFEDDIELDKDPDYVPEPEPVAPSTSKGKALLKPTAVSAPKTTAIKSAEPGGRTKAPIWAYYVPDDKKVNGHIVKAAICQVKVGGIICAKRLLQTGSTTSGLNSHLFSKHPKVWEQVKSQKANQEAEHLKAKTNLRSLLDKLEGTPSKKGRYDDQDQPTPGNPSLQRTSRLHCKINLD